MLRIHARRRRRKYDAITIDAGRRCRQYVKGCMRLRLPGANRPTVQLARAG
jgi:hypothetical protein